MLLVVDYFIVSVVDVEYFGLIVNLVFDVGNVGDLIVVFSDEVFFYDLIEIGVIVFFNWKLEDVY